MAKHEDALKASAAEASCPQCAGLGMYTRNDLAEHPDDFGRMYTCARCKGAGKIAAPTEAPPVESQAALRTALNRQCDNMAFVINHMTIPAQYYEKFIRELEEDRAALAAEGSAE